MVNKKTQTMSGSSFFALLGGGTFGPTGLLRVSSVLRAAEARLRASEMGLASATEASGAADLGCRVSWSDPIRIGGLGRFGLVYVLLRTVLSSKRPRGPR